MSAADPSGDGSAAREAEALARQLSRWVDGGGLPPEAGEALRSLVELSGRLAAANAELAAANAAQEGRIAELAATKSAQEGQIAELAAKVAALSAHIAQLQRALYGSRSEKGGRGGDGGDSPGGGEKSGGGKDSSKDPGKGSGSGGSEGSGDKGRSGGRDGRTKDRGDAATDSGLRFSEKAPVVDIPVMPPEIKGLPEDACEMVSERVQHRLAALDFQHVVIRYRYVKVRIRETGSMVSAPAREGVFRNSCADVSFISGMLIDKFLWHLPLYRQHRMLEAAGITVSRGTLSLWANRAIALLEPVHDAQWRSVLESAVIQMDETPIRAGRHPGKPGSMKKGFFWPVLGDRGEVVFPFSGSREHRNAADFLGDYAGTLVSDGYGAYEAYAGARGDAVRHQTCWTYVAAADMLRSGRSGLPRWDLPHPAAT